MAGRIDVRGIEFEVIIGPDLADVPGERFAEAQALDARALHASLPELTDDEISLATGGDDPDRYDQGRRDANSEVGRRYRAGQLYDEQIQVFALIDDMLVGETFGADNTSGDDRQAKMDAFIPTRKWDWHGMIAVDPNQQGRGLARVMSALILAERSLLQPISMHAWNVPHVDGLIRAGRLRPREAPVTDHPFGESGPDISRQWYVGSVLMARLGYLQQRGAVESYTRARGSAARNDRRYSSG